MSTPRVILEKLIGTAAAKNLPTFRKVELLEKRAKRGSLGKFEAALAKLPDVEPEDYDKL
jgi:hypothetical protein